MSALAFGLIMVMGSQYVMAEPYANQTYGIQLEYPDDWEVEETNYATDKRYTDIVQLYSPLETATDKYRDYVQLTLDGVPYVKVDLDGYIQETTDGYKETLKNFRLLDTQTSGISLGGFPGYAVTFSYNFEQEEGPDLRIKAKEVGAIVGKKVYYVVYYPTEDTFQKFLPNFENIVDSIRFSSQASPIGDDQDTVEEPPQAIRPQTETSSTSTSFQGTSIPRPPSSYSYHNEYFGIKNLIYPEDWTVTENESSINLASPSPKGDVTPPVSIYLSAYSSDNQTITEFATDGYYSISQNSLLLESKPILLEANQPAHFFTYAFTDNQTRDFKHLSVLSVKNDVLYVLDYEGDLSNYNRYLPVVLEIIRTLEFSEAPDSGNVEIEEPPAYLAPL